MATRREATDGESTVYDESEDATTRGGTDDLFAFTDRTAVDAGLPRRAVGLPAVTGPRPPELITPADPDEETAYDPPLVDALVSSLPTDLRGRVGSFARAEASAPTLPRGVAESSLATQPRGGIDAAVTQPRGATPARAVELSLSTQPRAAFGEEGTNSTVSRAVVLTSASDPTQPRVVPPVMAASLPVTAVSAPPGVAPSELETHVAPPPAGSLLIADFEPTHEVDSTTRPRCAGWTWRRAAETPIPRGVSRTCPSGSRCSSASTPEATRPPRPIPARPARSARGW